MHTALNINKRTQSAIGIAARCGQTAACMEQISGLRRIKNGRSVQKYREINNFEALKKIMERDGKYLILIFSIGPQ